MSGRPRLHRPLAVGTSSGAPRAGLLAKMKPWGIPELTGLPVALAICKFLKLLRALAAWLGSVFPGMSVLLGLPTSLAFCTSSEDEVGQRLRAAPYLHARSACMPTANICQKPTQKSLQMLTNSRVQLRMSIGSSLHVL